uniref:Sugar fermentation stimulation protein C-terminal domain-containing protein n=1 Tax=viral metagenome TaxID=1070528 RepID=A0A6C0KYM1_9ZZZZ|tara:strand:- start:36845 stop:37678 length:834 start_codon:yes stop_codon:yes gene_type:complete
MSKILAIDNLVKGKVIKRPSASCKTPYVADVELEDGTIVLAHTTSLGCGGLVNAGSNVLMTKVDKVKNVCKFKVILSIVEERGNIQYIGTDTSLPEQIVKKCLENNLIKSLNSIKSLKSQTTFMNSRFDFAGIDENDNEFILEVKHTPKADYVDCLEKDRKKMDLSNYDYNDKISYFPDGYRKKVKDTISPRALKHINELSEIKKNSNKRTIICYVIQRTDVSSFQPSNIDPIYKEAVINAVNNGVQILPLVIKWTKDGECHFVKDDLKVNIIKNNV